MRFSGAVGYGEPTETSEGVWEDVIEERTYQGDVIRNIKREEINTDLNNDLAVNNSISIVADEYAISHFFKIKYVMWEGVRWTVSAVEVRSPRLILSLGRVYNGPTP